MVPKRTSHPFLVSLKNTWEICLSMFELATIIKPISRISPVKFFLGNKTHASSDR